MASPASASSSSAKRLRMLVGRVAQLGVWAWVLLTGLLLYWLGSLSVPRIEWATVPEMDGQPTYTLTTLGGAMNRAVTYVHLSEKAASTPGTDSRKLVRAGFPILAALNSPRKSSVPPECTVGGWHALAKAFDLRMRSRPAWILIGKWRPEVAQELIPLLHEADAPCVYVVSEWDPKDSLYRSLPKRSLTATGTSGRFSIVCSQIVPADAVERIRRQLDHLSDGRVKIDAIHLPHTAIPVTHGAYLRKAIEAVSGLVEAEVNTPASPPRKVALPAGRSGTWIWASAACVLLGGTAAGIAFRPFGFGRSRRRASLSEKLSIGTAIALVSLQLWVHWALPLMPPTPVTRWLADNLLIARDARPDWQHYADEVGNRYRSIGDGIENLHLARRERGTYYSSLDDEIFRRYLLSCSIDDQVPDDHAWKAAIWRAIGQWTRRINTPREGARSVASILSERLTVRPGTSIRPIGDMWREGVADETGFQRVYVAALRTAGIAARLSAAGQAEYWIDNRWEAAPRPFMEPFQEFAKRETRP